jgi:hypothetical protein
MNIHGNSNQNINPHHLYEIWDKELDSVFKYGISADPIGADGLSKRLRRQLTQFNLVVGWQRFSGRILIENIPDRIAAKDLEDAYIENFARTVGERPRGNPLKIDIDY